MASAQLAGLVRIIGKKPTGEEAELYSSHVTVTAPGGGSPDGAGSSTPKLNERVNVPVNTKVVLRTNDTIFVEFISEVADGADVSDSLWAIPIFIPTTGQTKFLSRTDFANPAPADYTAVVDIPVRVGGYKITEGQVFFGGGPLYVDVQNDTA